MQFSMNRRESLVSEIAWAQGVQEGFLMAMRQISLRASQALTELDAQEAKSSSAANASPKPNGLPVHPSMEDTIASPPKP